MNQPSESTLRPLLLQSQPALLLHGLLLYGLGAAIARYLGFTVGPVPYLAGQVIVLALQVGAHYLMAFYAIPGQGMDRGGSYGEGVEEGPAPPARWLLYTAVAAFAIAAVTASLLVASSSLPPPAAIIGAIGAVAAVAYAVPPLRLETSGYGELLAAFCTAVLIPSFSFSLHTAETHRLLPLTTTPLACFTFAALLAHQLPSFGRDSKGRRKRLMVRLGWQRALHVHDGALILGLALQGALLLLGFPRRVAWGGLLGIPLAAALIWYLRRIRQGAPARWTLLRISSQGLAGLMTYLSLTGYLLS